MSLFFDAAWFDARLRERGLDRAALAAAANMERADLDLVFSDERGASASELAAFAQALNLNLVEVSLRSGIASRGGASDEDTGARIDGIEARLDAIDNWLAEMEGKKRA